MTPKRRSLETFPQERDNYLSSPRVTLSDDEVAEEKKSGQDSGNQFKILFIGLSGAQTFQKRLKHEHQL